MTSTATHRNVVVFVGPTIGVDEVSAALPGADVRAPAARGDVYRAVRRGATVIGVVDGVFERVPSIWHKEVLYALESGVHVVGSSSMGALRAAELDEFGMVGVGRVYDLVRQGLLDDDDVAVAHASADEGFRCLSTALVDMRLDLEAAVGDDVIDANLAATLLDAQKATFYPDRSAHGLLAHAGRIDPERGARLAAWWAANAKSQKYLDAQMLCAHVGSLAAERPPRRRPTMARTVFFEQMIREETSFADDDPHDGWAHPIIEELQVDPARYREIAGRALQARHARELARMCGHEVDQALVDATAARLHHQLGLRDASDLDRWLEEQHLTMDDYVALVGRRARSAVGAGRLPTLALEDLVDESRLEGLWPAITERSARKTSTLRAAGWDEVGAGSDDGGDRERALTWWLDRHFEGDPPRDLDALARQLGFADRALLAGAVLREYRYSTMVESSPETIAGTERS